MRKSLVRRRGYRPAPHRWLSLQDFARCRYVHLGNHTRDHGILTNYTATGIAQQLGEAQNDLERMVGIKPSCVSYPNGNYSPEVLLRASPRPGGHDPGHHDRAEQESTAA